ncbi:MAG TPA: protein-methionine-sulfoxide reductase heme-binding subunit MsrQ [Longimicrobiaceae bacterium]|nr:protein-methionine-sulfoxide reductase heme-binding subunit MsrQ [Longimicrobiaceae bacterium]
MAPSPRAQRVLAALLKPAVWIGGLLPLALLVGAIATGTISQEPIEDLTHRTGKAALTLLLATLAMTPVRRLTGWNGIVPARRPLGLFAFFYACLHFLVYLFDQGFAPGYIVEDVAEHPYVTAGFAALVLLVPLALTSTRGWIRRLGKGWQKLHRLVYLAAALGVVHFLWGVKKDLREPLIYAAVLAALLAFRLPQLRKRRAQAKAARVRMESDAQAA